MTEHPAKGRAERPVEPDHSPSRRRFLTGLSALGASAAWLPLYRLSPASAEAGCALPPAFPPDIALYQQAFQNWSGGIKVDALWTCVPRHAEDVVTLANWARAAGYTLRPRGHMHNWSPLTITGDTGCEARTVMVDTTQHLTAMRMAAGEPAAVTVGAGATMDALLQFLEEQGYGLLAVPAPGDVTVGGVLAIDGHGTGVPARGETRVAGQTYGSLSNLITSITAIVWNEHAQRYEAREFPRAQPQSAALLTHLGRAFITEVTLRVAPDYRLRCVSRVDIPVAELFADPGAASDHSLSAFVDQCGRVEVIWFPFTDRPWLKLWSLAAVKPLLSREVDAPYNYSFAENYPPEMTALIDDMVSGNGAATPTFGQMEFAAVTAGLKATQTEDLWGWSKNLLLYVRPTTLRVTANGYAVLLRRRDLQRALAEFAHQYTAMMADYQARGEYPINGPVEIRVTGLDVAADCGVPRAPAPALSALRPRTDHPEWDVALWFDLLTFPGTPLAERFLREFEQWLFRNYAGDYATARPEWSKGWAYTETAAWSDSEIIERTIPALFSEDRGRDWDWARNRLNALDPHRIFSNPFLDQLLP